MFVLSEGLRQELQSFDTPTVCNALEALAPARRGYGFTTEPLFCLRPALKPVVAVAKTATIRAAHPRPSGAAARRCPTPTTPTSTLDRSQRRRHPRRRRAARLWGARGRRNGAIHKGLGCEEGVITDGSVRDLPDVAEGFQMLAGRVGPSHAFVHIVDFGRAVDVAGMRVRDGDLISAADRRPAPW